MPLSRKAKRAPGENPILRRAFIHELRAQDHAGDLFAFLDDLADENLDIVNPYMLLEPHLDELVIDAAPPRVPEAGLTPVLGRGFFRSWLRRHGVDPKTGRMTLDGLAFFQDLTNDVDRPAA